MKTDEAHPKRWDYDKTVAYYMSGTGNTFRVAIWFQECAHLHGIEYTISPIENAKPDEEIEAYGKQLVALFMPTHGFTSPWHMIKFAFRMPRKKGVHAFCVATRGSTKVGSKSVPRAAGTAALLIGLILLFKGYCLKGITAIDMPSNWMSLYSGFSTENAKENIERGQKKATRIYNQILSGGSNWWTLSNCWDVLIFGIPLIWLSVGYLLIGRFFLAKLFFSNNNCTSCGICVRNCPTHYIKMVGKHKPRPYWKYNCESCMRCMGYCPNKAVEAGQSWAVVLWLITSFPLGVYLLSLLSQFPPELEALNTPFTIGLL